MMGVSTSDAQTYDPFYDRATWELKRPLWPRRCAITDKFLWFKSSYRGRRIITGPGEPVIEDRWHSKNDHIIWLLKR